MHQSRSAALLLLLLVVMVSAANSPPARAGQAAPVDDDVIWTAWATGHHTLLEDGDTLWIGTASGLVNLNKQTGAFVRYSKVDGLPHQNIYAAVIDAYGNRWFGGDGGLSKLSQTGDWTHYNDANSGLNLNQVKAIALSATGDLWLGTPDAGRVSRLHPDGSWSHYPNRETAVSLGFSSVKQTINPNTLWTVAGDEVWIGYDVYDGSQWQRRQPEFALSSPRRTVADSRGRLYAMDDAIGGTIFRWEDPEWSMYIFQYGYSGYLNTITVDQNDTVWVGGVAWGGPYANPLVVYGPLPEEPTNFYLENGLYLPPGISVMLAASDGLWITGPNWLRYPDGREQRFDDIPFSFNLIDMVVDGHGTVWVNTTNKITAVLQTLDDRGTGTTTDDRGAIVDEPFGIRAVALASNGDLWLAGVLWSRFELSLRPRRYFGDQAVDFYPPDVSWPSSDTFIHDIFVEDARHTWFVFTVYSPNAARSTAGIWRLDDGGTPAYFRDDVWTTYAAPGDGSGGVVAARDGRLWYGDRTGVYLSGKEGWRRLYDRRIGELIPARDGVLVINDGYDPLIITADGQSRRETVEELLQHNLALVRSTTERNQLWHIAPDGAIWYWHDSETLGRYDGRILQTFPAPVSGGFIQVDQNNHVWLVGEPPVSWQERGLWRVSPRPGFDLAAGPSTWFLRPNESRAFVVSVRSIDGYAKEVQLKLADLPAGVTGVVEPKMVLPGNMAVVTLTSSGAPLGTTTVKLNGISGEISRTEEINLSIVDQVHGAWLPVLHSQARRN